MSQQQVTITITARDGATQTFQAIGRAATGMASTAQAASGQATGALQRVATQATTTERAVGGIGRGFDLVTGAAAGLVGSAVVGFLSDAARAAAESEAVMARLTTAVEATGASMETLAPAIERATAAATRLAFDDEAAAAALATLTQQTGDAEQALQLLGLTMDVARGRGVDLETAANAVGKAAAGSVTSLQRMGVVIDEGATATEALAAAQETFAGQADAYASTTQGAFDRAATALGNVTEAIGDHLGPAQTLIGLLPGISSGFSLAASAAGALSGIGGLAGLTAAINPATLAVGGLVLAVGLLATKLYDASVQVGEYNDAMETLLTLTQQISDPTLAAGIAGWSIRLEEAAANYALAAVGGENFGKAVALYNRELTESIDSTIESGRSLYDLNDLFAAIDGNLKRNVGTVNDASAGFNAMQEIIASVGPAGDQARSTLDLLNQQLKDGVITLPQWTSQVERLAGEFLPKWTEASDKAAASNDVLATSIVGTRMQYDAIVTAAERRTEAEATAAAAAEEASAAARDSALAVVDADEAAVRRAEAMVFVLDRRTTAAEEAGAAARASAMTVADADDQAIRRAEAMLFVLDRRKTAEAEASAAARGSALAVADADEQAVRRAEAMLFTLERRKTAEEEAGAAARATALAVSDADDEAVKRAEAMVFALDRRKTAEEEVAAAAIKTAMTVADADDEAVKRAEAMMYALDRRETAAEEAAAAETERANEIAAALDRVDQAQQDVLESAQAWADAEIAAAESSANERVRAAQEASDELVRQAERAADAQIREVERAGSAAAKAAQQAANEQVRAAERAEAAVVDAARRQADEQIAEAERAEAEIVRAAERAADAQVRVANDVAREATRAIQIQLRAVEREADLAYNRATSEAERNEQASRDSAEREYDARVQAAENAADREIDAIRRRYEGNEEERLIREAEARRDAIIRAAEEERQAREEAAAAERERSVRDAERAMLQIKRQAQRQATQAERQELRKVEDAKREAARETEAAKRAAAERTAEVTAAANARVEEQARLAARETAKVRREGVRSVARVERATATEVREINRETAEFQREQAREVAATARLAGYSVIAVAREVERVLAEIPQTVRVGLTVELDRETADSALAGRGLPATDNGAGVTVGVEFQANLNSLEEAKADAAEFAGTTYTATLGADKTEFDRILGEAGVSAERFTTQPVVATVTTNTTPFNETIAALNGTSVGSVYVEVDARTSPRSQYRLVKVGARGTGTAASAETRDAMGVTTLPASTARGLPVAAGTLEPVAVTARDNGRGERGGGGGMTFYGPVHVHAATPDIAREIQRQLATRGRA